MGRQVTIDLATGAGSSEEFLMGTVTVESNALHYVGNTLVLPDPVELQIFNGKATHPDMAVSPPGPEPEWAYKFTFKSGITGRAWSQFAGVPDGTEPIVYKQLPKFTTAVPSGTTAEQVQNWAATAQDGAERAEAAAERAEAAYGAVVLVPVPEADIYLRDESYWTLRKLDTTALLQGGVEYVLEFMPSESFTLPAMEMAEFTGAMIDTVATDVKFVAGVKLKINYTPSQNGMRYLRLLASANKVSSLKVFTVTREDKLVELRAEVEGTQARVEVLETTVNGSETITLTPNQEVLDRDANYKTIRTLAPNAPLMKSGTEYVIEMLPTVSFTAPVLETAASPGAMIDTVATDVKFVAGVKRQINYIPSRDDIMYLRILGQANNLTEVKVYTVSLEGGLVDEQAKNEADRAHNGLDSYHLAHKLNRSIAELRTLKNNVDESLASLTQVQSTPGVTKTATIPAGQGKLVRVGLHYGPARFTPSAEEIFFDGESRTDFTDVRFFDANGKMLKAQLGELIHADMQEDSNLTRLLLVTSTGKLIGSNAGILVSSDNGATWQLVDGTKDVTTNPSQTYGSTSMLPILLDSADNLFAYAGGILYKLLASDGYATKTPVCTFSWTPAGGGATIYPDVKEHAAVIGNDGTMYFGIYQEEYKTTIYRSTNGGSSWSVCFNSEGAELQHVHHMHADKFTGAVYAGIDDGGRTFNGPHILKTTNAGVAWTDLTDGNHAVRGRDFYPRYSGSGYRLGGGEAYYLGGGTVYRSEDDKKFDIPVLGVGGVRDITDFGDDKTIVAGVNQVTGSTENQLLVSYDQGRSWATFYRKLQPVVNTSGRGFRVATRLKQIQGDTSPCVIIWQGIGTDNLQPVRLYPGAGWYREAFILLDTAPTGPVTITAKTGYMMGYPYKTLQTGKEHTGLVYHVPLNEGSGRLVSDSEGTVAAIEGNDYEWDTTEEPVRYGDYGGENIPVPLMPSAGLMLTKGTKLNFGKISKLDFKSSFTLTFWVNPRGRLMDEAEYNDRSQTMGLFSAGNVAFFNEFTFFGYTTQTATTSSIYAEGYRRMRTRIEGYAYSDQYFFVAITVNADGSVKTYINGANYGNAPESSKTLTMNNLSTGDFVIGSDLLESAGYLSNIKVYNRIIPDAEILDMYRGL